MASKIMKISLLVIVITFCNKAMADKDYFKEFYQLYTQAHNKDLSREHREQFEKEYNDYLESLTAEQALRASEQYWLYLEEETNFSPIDVI